MHRITEAELKVGLEIRLKLAEQKMEVLKKEADLAEILHQAYLIDQIRDELDLEVYQRCASCNYPVDNEDELIKTLRYGRICKDCHDDWYVDTEEFYEEQKWSDEEARATADRKGE